MNGREDIRAATGTYLGCLLLILSYGLSSTAQTLNVSGSSAAAAAATEYCEGSIFSARCTGADEVVVMETALFGRIRTGAKCITVRPETTCQVNVRDQFDGWCSGQRSCDVRVSFIVDLLQNSMRCLQESRGYLEASYTCVRAVSVKKEDCSRRNSVADVPVLGTGYVASVVTEETGCGSTEVPWILRASPGQQIRLRMYDFAVAGRDPDQTADQYPRVCQVYAVVKETPVRTSETICGGDEREQTVYASVTNQLELRMVAASVAPKKNQTRRVHYMIRYEVTGCPDLIPGRGQWVARQEQVSTLVCNSTGEKWQLNCEDGEWIGQRKNCSSYGYNGSASNKPDLLWAIFTGSQWAAIAIVLGIAVTIGLVIFLVGLFYLKRRRPSSLRGGGGHSSVCSSAHCVPSYHLAHCTAADPILAGSKSLLQQQQQPARPGDANYSSAENDYFRTWQLQRQVVTSPVHCPATPGGAQQQQSSSSSGPRFTVLRACPAAAAAAAAGGQFQGAEASAVLASSSSSGGVGGSVDSGVVGCGGRRVVIEHIYESPKFERRDLSSPEGTDSPSQRPGTPLQYHELDPHGGARA